MAIPRQVKQRAKAAEDRVTGGELPEDAPPDPTDQSEVPAPKAAQDYQAQYEEMKRRYDGLRSSRENSQSQVHDLRAQTERLSAELTALREQNDAMRRRIESQPQQGPTIDFLSEEEKRVLDQDTLNVIGKVADRIAQQRSEQMRQELDGLNRRFADERKIQQETASRSHRTTIEAAMDGAMPKWREIDTNRKFMSWLNEVDLSTGFQRSVIYRNAYNAGNVDVLVKLYQSWDREHGSPEPAPRTQSPNNRGGSAPVDPAAGVEPVYAEDIKKFYRDVRARKYVGREQEKAAFEQRIAAASKHGQIIP